MHKIIVVTLTVSVSLFAQAGGTWTSTTGGDIRSDDNYSDGAPGTSDDLYFANTQSAAVTASGDVQVGRILFYKKTNSYRTFNGDLDLGAGRSLLAAKEVFVSHGAKVHLKSGHLGIALDATAPTRNSYICSENDDGNELTIDGPNSKFTVSLAKGMQVMRKSRRNVFKVCNGASFEGPMQEAFMESSASNNLICVTDPGTTFTIPQGSSASVSGSYLCWGESGSFNEFCVSNYAWLGQLSAYKVCVGVAYSTSPAGACNRLKIADHAVMDTRTELDIGWDGANSNVLEIVDGGTLYMTNANFLAVGRKNSVGNRVILARGGQLVMSGNVGFAIGNYDSSRDSEMRIESGAEFRTEDVDARCYCVGTAGVGARLVIDGGTFHAPGSALVQAPSGKATTGSSVEVLNGGVVDVKLFNACSSGSGHSVVVSNGYITTASSGTFRLGVDGGTGSVLTIAGTNSQINCFSGASFKGGCTINFNVPPEGFKRLPFYVNRELEFKDATTINVTVDRGYVDHATKEGRRIRLIKSQQAIDWSNVTINLSAGLSLDTETSGELAVICPGKGLLVILK